MVTKLVDTSIICGWLGIPPDQWPPDHYTLLGLKPGEQDMERIERQVQQRLEQVRRYQLTNPEPATEAMNRVAQAFVCLTDPQARQAYDLSLFGGSPPTPAASAETATAPQPVAETEADAEFLALVEEGPNAVAPPTDPAASPSSKEPAVVEEEVEFVQRGLGTRRAIYRQIVQTRALIRLWERAGRVLGQPKKRLSRPSEARDLIDVLTKIRTAVEHLPSLLGEAGQPGYLVLSLAKQTAVVPTFQTLLPSQREALARDWTAGQKTLKAHQDFLRQESRALRRKTIVMQLVRAARTFLNENPAGWLIVAGLVIVIVALIRRTFMD